MGYILVKSDIPMGYTLAKSDKENRNGLATNSPVWQVSCFSDALYFSKRRKGRKLAAVSLRPQYYRTFHVLALVR